jgi:hypothetical protein
MTSITTGNLDASNGGVALVGNNSQITVNYQKSQDWQDFLAERYELREQIALNPNVPYLRREFAELEQDMAAFKRNVLKLAVEINKIPLNTERLKRAVQYFNTGDYAKARAVLDVPELMQEQASLLARWQLLKEQRAIIQAALNDKANEYLLLAQLRAIDYSLGAQLIAKTCEAFEQALQSGRTPERLFQYALFLRQNKQSQAAETLYREALDVRHKPAEYNPSIHVPNVTTTLNNLDILVKADNRRQKAETLYREVLEIRSKLAKDNPVYLPNVATTLNNLGALVMDDSRRRAEAETFYLEALENYRTLAKDNPSVYLPDVATTLNNLGALVVDDSRRRAEAETFYREALDIRRTLAKDNPNVYLPDVAMMLNKLGILVKTDSSRREEAETLYREALGIRRTLAKDNPNVDLSDVFRRTLAKNNPNVYLPNVAGTLNNLGNLVAADSNRSKEAETLYREALEIRRKLAADNSSVYLPYVAGTLNNLGNLVVADSTRRKEAETLYREALEIRRKLAADNPSIYLPDVVKTLGGFGRTHLQWGEPAKARVYLQEAADLIKPFAAQHPNMYGRLQDAITQWLAEANSATQ